MALVWLPGDHPSGLAPLRALWLVLEVAWGRSVDVRWMWQVDEFAADHQGSPGSNIHGSWYAAMMPVASCGSDSHWSHEYLGSSQAPSWWIKTHTYLYYHAIPWQDRPAIDSFQLSDRSGEEWFCNFQDVEIPLAFSVNIDDPTRR